MPSETIKQCFRRHQHLRGFAIFTKTVSQNPVIPAQAGMTGFVRTETYRVKRFP
ncbi:hypothetical protein [Neisseria cinerea]|uniref:Uncharacterized protein n=1 Tax=Neisseria cinerea TaxID=483 RepID=A0A7T3BP05_NEICI|nr:hypothetical protein [Neisseria cinerea]QPT38349.1 hypothetical protein I6G28_02000 [Neisseria cinerea]